MDYRAIAQSLVELHAALRLGPVARQLSELDCGTFLALQLLSSGDAHPCELSRKMGVSTARVAALVNHLERDGLAVRRPDPDDSRAVTVSLTPAGKARICEKREAAVSALAGALQALGPREAQAYLRIQRKILSHMTQHGQSASGLCAEKEAMQICE